MSALATTPASAPRLPPVRYVRRRPQRVRVAPPRAPLASPGPWVWALVPKPALWLALVALSAGAHALVLRGAGTRGERPAERRVDRTRVVVVAKPAPPAIEPAKPSELPPVAKLARVDRSKKVVARTPEVVPVPPVPPPRAEAPPSEQPPVLMPGIALSSTSTAGSFAVPTGNTLAGRPGTGRAGPKSGGGGDEPGAAGIAPGYALTEPPVFLDNVSADDVRRFYPEEARKAKVEGIVRVMLTVGADGRVAKVSVLADPGQGFGAAGAKLARLYRFKPAKIDGRAVATEIPFTIRFVLD